MRVVPLSASASVTLTGGSGTGTGTVSVGPKFAGEVWFPESVSISCTGNQPAPSAPNIATCDIYVGINANSATFLDGTYQVLGASSSMIGGQTVFPGYLVIAVWNNCNGGQAATITVIGKKRVP